MIRVLPAVFVGFALAVPAFAGPPAMSFDEAKRHWAYQPIIAPTLPSVKLRDWPATAVDQFILTKLEANKLRPSPPADRRTLLRRVYYDLIGLPPTVQEVEAFERDASPDAYAKVVERLLASPHYGERWGRHWLDVARYADTKDGVLMYGDDRVRPYAYTYRDYVIRALNADTPFDRFVHEQLAADQIAPKVEPWRLAAMGFLTLGRQFDNNVHDIIDDRIDTVTRGFLGLTVACARCHDHKYDAVPTRDYYSLYGVFASCEAPLELPTTDAKLMESEIEKQLGAKRRELQKFLDEQHALLLEDARTRVGDYLVHIATTPPDPLETAVYFLSLAPTDLRPPIIASWRRHLELHAKSIDPVFGPWHELMAVPDAEFAKSRDVVQRFKSGPINPLVLEALLAAPLANKGDVARAYGRLFTAHYQAGKQVLPTDAARRQIFDLVASADSPAFFPKSRTWQFMSRKEKDAFGGKLQELDRMAVKSPHAAPRAMTLVDSPELLDPRVFVRGNASRLGEPVPRQFLEVVAGARRKPFPHGSGRLDLARSITDAKNPLTARVIANRLWMHHFGEPLVSTPSDFGARSNPPTHPELLDFLASSLMHDGAWSLKYLHRLMVLSSTYQQSSEARNAELGVRNESNDLYARMNRRRVEMESMRDAMLVASGRLDTSMHGRPVDVASDASNRRRTVYGMVDRQSLPGLFRAFDFASPDASAERRPKTVVPQQALFGLNSPYVLEQARAIAARSEVNGAKDDAERVAALYRVILARSPDGDETKRGMKFLRAGGPVAQLAQVLLLTNEFTFVD